MNKKTRPKNLAGNAKALVWNGSNNRIAYYSALRVGEPTPDDLGATIRLMVTKHNTILITFGYRIMQRSSQPYPYRTADGTALNLESAVT